MLNSKVIGLIEYEYIMHEAKQLVFPNDFPQTNAFKIFNNNKVNFIKNSLQI